MKVLVVLFTFHAHRTLAGQWCFVRNAFEADSAVARGVLSIRVYLAGPDVFLPNARDVGRRKIAICREHGFEGLFPLDAELSNHQSGPRETAFAISKANEALIASAHAVFANLTPFRSPSADVGTVYEVGFARARGKIIFGYTADARGFEERVSAALRIGEEADRDASGIAIEKFGLIDNLMIDGAVRASGGVIIRPQAGGAAGELAAFAEFEEVVRVAKETLRSGKGRDELARGRLSET